MQFTSPTGHHARCGADDNHCGMLYQMPEIPVPHCKSLWQPAIGRRSVGRDRSWPKGRSVVSRHRLIGRPGRVGGSSASVRLTALPPTPPLELSCLIRIIPRSDRPSLSYLSHLCQNANPSRSRNLAQKCIARTEG